MLPSSPPAGGVRTGKYSRGELGTKTPSGFGKSRTRKDINIATGRLSGRNLAIAGVVSDIAGKMGITSAQVAMAWTLLNPAVVSSLIGARTVAPLTGNLAALDVGFDARQVTRLDEAGRIEPGSPHDLLKEGAPSMMFGGVKVRRARAARTAGKGRGQDGFGNGTKTA